jgi:hypothetical protein
MFTRLRHRAVRRRHNQDRPIHLRRACDHVLHIIRVTRAIHMRVMTVRRLVFNMGRINRDPTLPFFGSLVDRRIILKLSSALCRQNLRDRRRQCRLAMINVADRANVAVRLIPLKLYLRHLFIFPEPYCVPKPFVFKRQTTAAVRQIRNQRFAPDNTGAGDGNRTHTTSLEGWGSTFELHPPN